MPHSQTDIVSEYAIRSLEKRGPIGREDKFRVTFDDSQARPRKLNSFHNYSFIIFPMPFCDIRRKCKKLICAHDDTNNLMSRDSWIDSSRSLNFLRAGISAHSPCPDFPFIFKWTDNAFTSRISKSIFDISFLFGLPMGVANVPTNLASLFSIRIREKPIRITSSVRRIQNHSPPLTAQFL